MIYLCTMYYKFIKQIQKKTDYEKCIKRIAN